VPVNRAIPLTIFSVDSQQEVLSFSRVRPISEFFDLLNRLNEVVGVFGLQPFSHPAAKPVVSSFVRRVAHLGHSWSPFGYFTSADSAHSLGGCSEQSLQLQFGVSINDGFTFVTLRIIFQAIANRDNPVIVTSCRLEARPRVVGKRL